MRRFTALFAAALFAAGLFASLVSTGAQPAEAPQTRSGDLPLQTRSETVRPFMQAKLDHAQQVLHGIAIEDYDRISRHGQAISLLSLESNWQVLQTEEYIAQSNEFRRAADALTRAGRNRDVDAATVAYLDLTVKCVNCHKYLRRHAAPAIYTCPMHPQVQSARAGRCPICGMELAPGCADGAELPPTDQQPAAPSAEKSEAR